MRLHQTAALITGGARIGAVVARVLAKAGADVAVTCHRSPDKARSTAQAIEGLGRRSLVVDADLSDPVACRRAVDETAAVFGRLDILVCMASIYRAVPFEALTDDEWQASINLDLGATFHCARAAVPHMRRHGGGRIVTFSDWVAASRRPRYLGYVPYYVAKAGVIALTEALALELAPDQILVNAIAPGPILAPPGTSQEEIANVARATPLGRWGGEQEVAQAVLALIESDFITGETIRVDGGRHLK